MTLIGFRVAMPSNVTLPWIYRNWVGPLGCGLVSGAVAGMTAGLDLTTGTFSQKGHGTLEVRHAAETLTVLPESVDPLVASGFGVAVGVALSVGAGVATGVGADGVAPGVGATGVGATDSTGTLLGDGTGSSARTMAPDPTTMQRLNMMATPERLTLDEATVPSSDQLGRADTRPR